MFFKMVRNNEPIHIKKLSNFRLCQPDILIQQKYFHLHLAVWRSVDQKFSKSVLFSNLSVFFHDFKPQSCHLSALANEFG